MMSKPISILCSVLVFVVLFGCDSKKDARGYDQVLLAIKRNYQIPRELEKVQVALPWDTVVAYLPEAENGSVKITGQNFGKSITPSYTDSNGDGTPEYIVFNYSFESTEPIFTFSLTSSDVKFEALNAEIKVDERLELSFLTPFDMPTDVEYELAKQVVASTMNIYPDTKDFPIYAPRRWNYEYGFFFTGCFRLGKLIDEQSYINYSQQWIDEFIDPSGGFREGEYEMSEYKLDDILPGRLAILMYQQTKDKKYKSIADTLRVHLSKQPKTSDGGYWHKQIYEHQMWLDGIFMADVFSTQYASAFDDTELYDEAAHQIDLIYRHTLDSATGLLYHGWDEAKNPVWADPVKGTSPEFWGRAVGWYLMALVECLDYIPTDHAARPRIETILKDLSVSVLKYQDKKSSLWYQVLDKGGREGNWIETSCSAMFAYAFAKGSRQGILDPSYANVAEEVTDALFRDYVFKDLDGNLHLAQTVKVGTLNMKTSKGDFDYYISTERRLDDYKGIAALLFACIELKK